MQKIFFWVLIIILTISCSKTDFSTEHKINDLVAGFEQETQNRTKLRLAFGKAVAAALGEKEFRDYIKDKSRKEGSLVFEELVFILIKDDILPSGRTIAQIIQDNEDSEVKSLFADDLITKVLQDDSMLAIKLPDLFFDVEWDTEHLIPFVGVQTALPFAEGYVHYYHNGYQDYIPDFDGFDYSDQKYFYIAVQHATNHILLNLSSLTSEKGITLEEFLPQIFYAKNKVLNDILNSGIRLPEFPNKAIINLKSAYNIWLNKNKFEGNLVGEIEPCGTRPSCLRDCIQDQAIANRVVMTGMELANDLSIAAYGLSFTETIIVSFAFLNRLDSNNVFRFTRPTRKAELIPELDIKVFTATKSYQGKRFEVPLVEVIYTRINKDNRKWVDINYEIDSNFQKENSDYSICVSLLIYSDLYNESQECDFSNSKPIFASFKRPIDFLDYTWCVNQKTIGRGLKLGLEP